MGNRLPRHDAEIIVHQLKLGLLNYTDIAKMVGCAVDTVSRYDKKLKMGRALPYSSLTGDLEDKCREMIDEGNTLFYICESLEISPDYVLEIAEDMLDAEDKSDRAHLWHWLRTHWRWNKPKKVKKTVSDDGYRIVKKGEKGHLITPYRPDRIFR